MSDGPLSASFRDPGGFLFRHQGRLLRQINSSYANDYHLLRDSGLYALLVEKHLLIPHQEADLQLALTEEGLAVIEPELIPFISYPYEWAFSQLKDAALATLHIQKIALGRGMSLKDASAYNIQFHRGRPVLIDTLSFEKYHEGQPWVAYRQFCQHFLAPLALMASRDVRLSHLLRTHIDGIPLDLASRLLPWRTRFQPGLLMHLHAHARSQKKHEGKALAGTRKTEVSKKALLGILDSLRGCIKGLKWKANNTEWADYYQNTNYSDTALLKKRDLVSGFLKAAGSQTVWDLGANNGFFSRAASDRGILTVALDVDPAAVEKNWQQCRRGKEPHLLPLIMDMTNPSPGLGFAHEERLSLTQRGPVHTIMALALVHHLAISNNVPLEKLAEYLGQMGSWLIIEFVPKSDSQVKRLLATREDVFPNYHLEGFEQAFGRVFEVVKKEPIEDTERTLYLLKKLPAPD